MRIAVSPGASFIYEAELVEIIEDAVAEIDPAGIVAKDISSFDG